MASSHGRPSDHALLVSQDGVVDHAGDGAHGRPQDGVVMQALHRDPPELQGTSRFPVRFYGDMAKRIHKPTDRTKTLRAPAGGY